MEQRNICIDRFKQHRKFVHLESYGIIDKAYSYRKLQSKNVENVKQHIFHSYVFADQTILLVLSVRTSSPLFLEILSVFLNFLKAASTM